MMGRNQSNGWTEEEIKTAVRIISRYERLSDALPAIRTALHNDKITANGLTKALIRRGLHTSDFLGTQLNKLPPTPPPAATALAAADKFCVTCGAKGGRGGFREQFDECRECEADGLQAEEAAEKRRAIIEKRQERCNSEYSSLKPEDFDHFDDPEEYDVTVANDHRIDKDASAQKRQEYSKAMGEFADALHDSKGDPNLMPEDLGGYIARLSEQERRFGNRRIARSVSLAAAHEALHRRQLVELWDRFCRDRVTPVGYATLKHEGVLKRKCVALISDLHLGAELRKRDNPWEFGKVEEARRLEFVLRQILDFKPQYREDTELELLLTGDLIDGLLMHDLRDGAPLAEQKLIFWRHFRLFVGHCAAAYKRVNVTCQPGNHGRDIVRHPGRATSRKWDGHEWEMYKALEMMCSGLANVTWNIPTLAIGIVDLFGENMLVTHADTEVKLGDPDTKAKDNKAELDKINTTRDYGVEFSVGAFGHYHKPRNQPGIVHQMWNGGLLPSNGHGRTNGYRGEPCGQWVWEAVEGYPVGDTRFVEVGPAQDNDERLGTLIPPFRMEDEES